MTQTPNQNNNTECCETCRKVIEMSMTSTDSSISKRYEQVICADQFCPNCHWTPTSTDTSEKERCCIYCGITYVGKECPKGCKGYTPLIQSSWEERAKELAEEFARQVYLNSEEFGSQKEEDKALQDLLYFIKNLLETEHKKWIANK